MIFREYKIKLITLIYNCKIKNLRKFVDWTTVLTGIGTVISVMGLNITLFTWLRSDIKEIKSENEKYRSAPRIVFCNEEKRKEWEEKRKEWEDLPPGLKKSVISNLRSMMDNTETKLSIDVLCNIIIDMDKRISDLEEKK